MNVSYAEPLRRAWERMVRMLFRPVRLEMWFVLGFAAFLADLGQGGTSGFGGRWKHGFPIHRGGWRFDAYDVLDRIQAHPVIASLAAFGIVCALLFVILLQWLSARGKLVFLEGVARERAAIVEPWGRLGHIGNGLFVWISLFGLIFGVIGLAGTFPLWSWLAEMVNERAFFTPPLAAVLATAAITTPLILAFLFVYVLLDHFVIPLMLRDGIGVTAAWAKFRPLLSRHPGAFVAYVIFLIGVWIVALTAVFAVGFASCCVGWLILAIPYVGTVALMPFEIPLRALGPEFLAQFGPEYTLAGFGGTAPAAPATPPAAPSPPIAPGP